MWKALVSLAIGGIFFSVIQVLHPIDYAELSLVEALVGDIIAAFILGGAYMWFAKHGTSRNDLGTMFFIYLGAAAAEIVIKTPETGLFFAIAGNFFSVILLAWLYVWMSGEHHT